MRLTPREVERLLLFQAAELARRRRGRGLLLNQAEATAVIADEVCEAARDGLGYEAVSARGYAVLGTGDVLDGVAALVPRIEVEALFGDGSRLIVLHDPIGRTEPPPALPAEPPLVWLDGALGPFAARNAAEVPIGLTSHVHLFELNRRLELDRGAVYGLRPALEAGAKVVIEPGTTSICSASRLRACASYAVTGAWSTERSTSRARASVRWSWRASGAISVPDPRVRLGDTGLAVEVERDDATGIATGMGGTLRDGLAVRAERGGVGLAITDVLLLDPVLGVRRTSIGVTDGRITAVGRAGNPDTMDAIDVVLDTAPR